MAGLTAGRAVRHPRFGRGQVISNEGQSVVTRFGHGIEECLTSELELLLSPTERLTDGQFDDPLSTAVRLLASAIRSVNSQWGVFTRSRVALLPHQLWVCRKVRESWPTRWLIADDVGLGKTIEAGLILLPLVSAGVVRRLLILTPASLASQWQQRLRTMFDLRLSRYAAEIDDAKSDFWATHAMVVASFHTLRQDRRGQKQRLLDADPFDLIIVDEAHHLNIDDKQGATLAFDLVHSLQERGKLNSLIFFTGTPHRGKDHGFLGLLHLVRPDLFNPERPMAQQWPMLRGAVIRNNKQGVTDIHGNKLFQPVTVKTETFSYSPTEQLFYDTLSQFILTGKAYASRLRASEQQSVMLVLITMQKLAASSVAAVQRALRRRLARIETGSTRLAELETQLQKFADLQQGGAWDEADEVSRLEEEIAEVTTLRLMEDEAPRLRDLLELAESVTEETKLARIIGLIRDRLAGEQVLLFTEYKATQALVLNALQAQFGQGCATFINGDEALDGIVDAGGQAKTVRMSRDDAADSFNGGNVRFLVSTEAAGEGIDLQERCANLIHVDLPWNPMRLHQRVGRLNRYGQTRAVTAFNLRNPDTVESRIWDKLNEKLERITHALAGAMDEPEDMLQLVLGMSSADLFTELFANGSSVPNDKLSNWFDSKTATFGGQDVVDTVKHLIGNVQRFDFDSAGRDMPMVDLPDLLPFFRHALALNNRRLTEEDGQLAFITPDAWRKKDFALLPRYENLVFDRKLKGRDAAQRILGVGHRVFDAAFREADLLDTQIAVVAGLEQPLFLYEVWDRITGTGSQLAHVLVGVSIRYDSSMHLLRDWEVIQAINSLKVSPRSADRRPGAAPTLGHAGAVERTEAHLRAKLGDLELAFRLPEVRLAGALIPSDT
jgi:ERCC4-related helicase